MRRLDAQLREVDLPKPPVVPREAWAEGAMTTTQVKNLLQVSKKTLFVWMKNGKLPWAQLGSRRRIPRRAVLDLLEGGG